MTNIPSKPSELFDKKLWTDEFQNTLKINGIELDPELQKKLINWEDSGCDFKFPSQHQLEDALFKSLQFTGTANLADIDKYLETTKQLLERSVDDGADKFFKKFNQDKNKLDRDFLAFQEWYSPKIQLRANWWVPYDLPEWYYVSVSEDWEWYTSDDWYYTPRQWDDKQLFKRNDVKKEFVLVKDTPDSPAYTLSYYFPDPQIFITEHWVYQIDCDGNINHILQNKLDEKVSAISAIKSIGDQMVIFLYKDWKERTSIGRLSIDAWVKGDEIKLENITDEFIDLPDWIFYKLLQFPNKMNAIIVHASGLAQHDDQIFYYVDENGVNSQWTSVPLTYKINWNHISYENNILSIDTTSMGWEIYTNQPKEQNISYQNRTTNFFKRIFRKTPHLS